MHFSINLCLVKHNKLTLYNVIKNRMKKLLWIGMLIVSLSVRAQFDAAFTNTWALQSYYNPAAAGLDSKLNIVGMYSMQMVGYEGAPKTMVINADMPLFFIGLFASGQPLMRIGIYCFALSVLFYLVTLPVEFDASSRAVAILDAGGLPEEELRGVKAVLRAAALTYVASALQALLQLLRLVLLSQSRRRRD